MPRSRRTPYNEQIHDEAADWFLRFCEDEIALNERATFGEWLRASPQHVRAYLEVAAFWEAAGEMNRTGKVPVEELVRQALAENNVVNLDQASLPKKTLTHRPRVLGFRMATAAAALVICFIASSITWWHLSRYPTYTTQAGEQRRITLADGSTVILNSRSGVKVRFSDAERDIELLSGQALFYVAKNPRRPFIVQSGITKVRAVGTEFDVYRKASGTVVTVVEGHVAVSGSEVGTGISSRPSEQSPPVLLSAGEQVTVDLKAVSAPQRANITLATAWSEGKLVFNQTPLSDVVQEFNRYNPRALIIDDPQLLRLHISGTFATTDSTDIVRFLSRRFHLVAHETDDAVRLTTQQPTHSEH